MDNDPKPAINVYDRSGFSGDVTVLKGAEDVVVAPESYEAVQAEAGEGQKDVDYTDDFSDTDLDNRYEKMGKDITANVTDGALKLHARSGDKLIMRDMRMADGIYEADITLDNLYDNNGNAGFTFRSANYLVGSDGPDGYYAGIGNGYVQVGRMNNNWKELANVKVPELKKGTTHRLRVAVFGSRIQVYVDDVKTPYVDIVDSTYTEGGASIRGFQSDSTIDNIRIASIPNYSSDFAHGTGEWDVNGIWKNEEGSYQANGKSSAFIDANALKDFRISADLLAEEEDSCPALALRASESADGVDGYRVVLNVKEDKIQLIKSQKGADTVLAERAWKLETGTAYPVSAEVRGSSLRVYLNNAPKAMFAVTDDTFEKGKVGFCSQAGTSVFDNLSINTRFVDGEVLEQADKAKLDNLISQAEKLEKDKYTEKSYARVETALAAAKEINPYDQAEIDKAAAGLQEALDLLIENGSGGITQEETRRGNQKAEAAQKAAEDAKALAEQAKKDAEKLAEEARVLKDAAEAAQKKPKRWRMPPKKRKRPQKKQQKRRQKRQQRPRSRLRQLRGQLIQQKQPKRQRRRRQPNPWQRQSRLRRS